jgi:hypothetical protein
MTYLKTAALALAAFLLGQLTALEAKPAGDYAIVITARNGDEYVVDHGLTQEDCAAEIRKWDGPSDNVRCDASR